jgi:hypothetical protein
MTLALKGAKHGSHRGEEVSASLFLVAVGCHPTDRRTP